MIDSSKWFEKFLQEYRFKMVLPYLKGDVLDFGGNKGELKKYVQGNYYVVNYDHSLIEKHSYDTIVLLAVIEHLYVEDVYQVFTKFKKVLRPQGKIILTTPHISAKSVLEFLALVRILDKENIEEHKHYWKKYEIYALADKTGFRVEKFLKFQLGFNQFAVFSHQ